MSLAFLFDEHLRGPAWLMVCRHNATTELKLDVVRVGDANCVPLGTQDSEILLWAEHEGRILVTRDQSTMQTHLDLHLRESHHSPGVFMIRPLGQLSAVIEFLVMADQLSDPHEWHDMITYIG